MKRIEFLKSGCTIGICSCMGFPFFAKSNLLAESGSVTEEKDWRIGFMQRRFAEFLNTLNTALDRQRRDEILEELGRSCAEESLDEINKFRNNPEDFLEEAKKVWLDSFEYNRDEKTIHLYGKKGLGCGCPFAEKSLTPEVLCNCSIGYTKGEFEILLGKPVDVAIEESVLRGGERCAVEIRIKE